MSTIQKQFEQKHYDRLVGKTIAKVDWDEGAWRILFTDGAAAWVVKDPEGNDGGWLCLSAKGNV